MAWPTFWLSGWGGGTAHTQPLDDTANATDALSKSPGRGFADTVTSSDGNVSQPTLVLADTTDVTDLAHRIIVVAYTDTQSLTDSEMSGDLAQTVGHVRADSIAPEDVAALTLARLLADTETPSDSLTIQVPLHQLLDDTVTATDTRTARYMLLPAETLSVGDDATVLFGFIVLAPFPVDDLGSPELVAADALALAAMQAGTLTAAAAGSDVRTSGSATDNDATEVAASQGSLTLTPAPPA